MILPNPSPVAKDIGGHITQELPDAVVVLAVEISRQVVEFLSIDKLPVLIASADGSEVVVMKHGVARRRGGIGATLVLA